MSDDTLGIPESPLDDAAQMGKAGKKGDAALKTASVLAFERKLDVSDGVMFSGDWADRAQKDEPQKWSGIAVQEKSVRGTISNRLKTKEQDPTKLDAQIENPNLQIVDNAALPWAHDTLKLAFTLRVLPNVGEPSACNNPAYAKKLAEIMKGYKEEHGFGLLAERYAFNLANARFLWRNRIGAEAIEVHVSHMNGGEPAQEWIFDALSYSLLDFTSNAQSQKDALPALAELIRDGFEGRKHVLLKIETYVRLGQSQEVFPSQELILNKGKGDKSRTLYVVKEGKRDVAAIHSQKIGNALRTIDTWYADREENGSRPIAIEPYGSVTTQGRAYRQPKKKDDFYNLLDGWALKDKKPETAEEQAYVVAMLIRGGVFGDAA